jgi:hypothetical protein
MKTFCLIVIAFLFVVGGVVVGNEEYAPLISKVIVLTKDFGGKLDKLRQLGIEPKEVFKEYGIVFPGESEVTLLENRGSYVLRVISIAKTLDFVEATCEWHAQYSPWFTAEMICPVDASVNEARYAGILEILVRMREERGLGSKQPSEKGNENEMNPCAKQ